MKKLFWIPFLIMGCSGENNGEVEDNNVSKENDTIVKGDSSKGALIINYSNSKKNLIGIDKDSKQVTTVEEQIDGPPLKTNRVCNVSLEAYIDDPSKTATNVRKTPGGEVVLQLPYAQDDYFLTIVDQKDGWFKVSSIEGIEVSYEIPEEGAWVHNSVVGAGTRNYGHQLITIYKYPAADPERTAGEIKIETAVHVLEICNDFVKIKTATGNQVGWVKKGWICGNPLTTCA